MEEKLTTTLLRQYGFTEDTIELFNAHSNFYSLLCNDYVNCYYATNVEMKIYSGEEGYRRRYLPIEGEISFPKYHLPLYPEFIERDLAKYLKGERENVGRLYREDIAIAKFISKAKLFITGNIEFNKAEIASCHNAEGLKLLARRLSGYEWCLVHLEGLTVKSLTISDKNQPPDIVSFEDLFFDPSHAEICLGFLKDLETPFVSRDNIWVGKNKGIFGFWIEFLKSINKNAIINPKHSNTAIAKALSIKIIGLNLHSTELSKSYKQLCREEIKLNMRILLSKSSLSS